MNPVATVAPHEINRHTLILRWYFDRTKAPLHDQTDLPLRMRRRYPTAPLELQTNSDNPNCCAMRLAHRWAGYEAINFVRFEVYSITVGLRRIDNFDLEFEVTRLGNDLYPYRSRLQAA